MIKADLHTHSIDSYDGGLSSAEYGKLIQREQLDVVAVTDHQSVAFAQELSQAEDIGSCVIVGQEIRTNSGEIIGLYLSSRIDDGLPLEQTIGKIQEQSGFILVPHPKDKFRDGLSLEDLEPHKEVIDAIELFNGRQIGSSNRHIQDWAHANKVPMIACSDAHSYSGAGRTYTMIESQPSSAESLRELLRGQIKPVYRRPPVRAYLAPKLNRLKKLIMVS